MLAEALFEVVFFSELADCLYKSKINHSISPDQFFFLDRFMKVSAAIVWKRWVGCVWVSFII